VPLFAAAALFAATLPPRRGGRAAFDAEVLRRWREHSADVARTEREIPRRHLRGRPGGHEPVVVRVPRGRRAPLESKRLHPGDREFITRAALEQTPAEFERNLPAIVGYLRLKVVLEDAAAAVRKLGSPHLASFSAITRLANEADAFRSRQERAVAEGAIDAAHALTRESVGGLADPELRAQALAAYRRNVRAIWRQEAMALLWAPLVLLSFGFAPAAVFIRWRARQGFPDIGLARHPYKS